MIYYFQYIFHIFILIFNLLLLFFNIRSHVFFFTQKARSKIIHVGPNIVSSWIMYFKLLEKKKHKCDMKCSIQLY